MLNNTNKISAPGEIKNLIVVMQKGTFIVNDAIFEESDEKIEQYKVSAECIAVSNYQDRYAVGSQFCWGFELTKLNSLKIRGWDFFNNDIFMPASIQGFGIGSFIMNLIIKAISLPKISKEIAAVKKLTLSAQDALDNDNKKRRNQFYRNFGFTLQFNDDEERSGYAYVDSIKELKQHNKPSQSYDITSLCKYLEQKQNKIDSLTTKNTYLTHQAESLSEKYTTLRNKVEKFYPSYWIYFILKGVVK